MKSLAENGKLTQFDGMVKYLSDLPNKNWDANRLCGDFFKAFSQKNTALCGKQFDVAKTGTNLILKRVIVECN